MSFLDSLEDNLKSLESQEDTAQRDRDEAKRREAQWAAARVAAPYAEELKSGAFTQDLLNQATRIGHGLRTKVHIAWMGTSLRLEARGRKLELRPTGEGVFAAFIENGVEVRTEIVDLAGDAGVLAREWLGAA